MIAFITKLVGYAAGCVIVALAGRYGFTTSDDMVLGSIAAFSYGLVAFLGTFGPMIAAKAGRTNKTLATFVLLFGIAALAANIGVDVQAMRGRGDGQTAQQTKINETVANLKAEREAKQDERDGMKFAPADETAVQAARREAEAATKAKTAECTVRGIKCQAKEIAEAETLAKLTAATSNKLLTDRGVKLDAEIAALDDKIAKAGPVRETNGPGKVLAELFGQPETQAAKLLTCQAFTMMTIAEIGIMLLLLCAEEFERQKQRQAQANLPAVQREAEESEPRDVIEIEAAEAVPTAELFPAPAKPRLVASNPMGNLPQVMADILEPGLGKIEIAELHTAYVEACEARSLRPIPATEFPAAIAALCETLKIEIKRVGTGVYLMRVKLKTAEAIGRALRRPRAQ